MTSATQDLSFDLGSTTTWFREGLEEAGPPGRRGRILERRWGLLGTKEIGFLEKRWDLLSKRMGLLVEGWGLLRKGVGLIKRRLPLQISMASPEVELPE